VRSIVAIVLVFSLGACSVLDRFQFGASSLDPSKIYLDSATVVSVTPRDAHRYACVGVPLLCVHYGVEFECRCP
jgi:hypothetical protein